MENKYIFLGIAILIAGGATYYYWDDISTSYDYMKSKKKNINLAKRKINSKPININIKEYNDL